MPLLKDMILKMSNHTTVMKLDPITTLAAPVLLGMMLNKATLPPIQSFMDRPSTFIWDVE